MIGRAYDHTALAFALLELKHARLAAVWSQNVGLTGTGFLFCSPLARLAMLGERVSYRYVAEVPAVQLRAIPTAPFGALDPPSSYSCPSCSAPSPNPLEAR